MYEWPENPITPCEEVQDHLGYRVIDDTDGVLICECTTCGAEWVIDENEESPNA